VIGLSLLTENILIVDWLTGTPGGVVGLGTVPVEIAGCCDTFWKSVLVSGFEPASTLSVRKRLLTYCGWQKRHVDADLVPDRPGNVHTLAVDKTDGTGRRGCEGLALIVYRNAYRTTDIDRLHRNVICHGDGERAPGDETTGRRY
jgi:hypothetical protein